MKLGILVNTDKHMDDVIGIAKAAVSRQHTVTIFTMDRGTTLFQYPQYRALCSVEGITMSFCDHNAKKFEADTEGIPDEIVCGSQFDNATMHHDCDKIIVL